VDEDNSDGSELANDGYLVIKKQMTGAGFCV